MLDFAVGLVVGASVVALVVILVGPSRRVRAEQPLPRDVETELLLGQDPERPTASPPPRAEHPGDYSASDLAQLRKLGPGGRRRPRRG